MKQITLSIKGMDCEHCKNAVTNALEELNGIESADVSLENGTADVRYDDDKVNYNHMRDAVEAKGYDIIA